MKAEDEIVTSSLSRPLVIDGKRLMINVYRGTFRDDDWFYEVVDAEGHADVSEHMYNSDNDAFEAALRAARASQ